MPRNRKLKKRAYGPALSMPPSSPSVTGGTTSWVARAPSMASTVSM